MWSSKRARHPCMPSVTSVMSFEATSTCTAEIPVETARVIVK